jgi:hypothetical protein
MTGARDRRAAMNAASATSAIQRKTTPAARTGLSAAAIALASSTARAMARTTAAPTTMAGIRRAAGTVELSTSGEGPVGAAAGAAAARCDWCMLVSIARAAASAPYSVLTAAAACGWT